MNRVRVGSGLLRIWLMKSELTSCFIESIHEEMMR